MSVHKVTDNIALLFGAWSNIWVLREGERVALIDTGLQVDRARILAGLAELGIREEQVEAVYLTHAHTDHGGNAAYFARRGAVLHVHQAEAPYIGLPRRTYIPAGSQRWTRFASTFLFVCGEILYPVERRNADILLSDSDLIEAPGGALRVIATPGHSPGHISFFRENDGILFSGDAVLTLIPITRQNALSLPMRVFSANWEQTKQSALRVASLHPSLLLAGHGWPLKEHTSDRLTAWVNSLL